MSTGDSINSTTRIYFPQRIYGTKSAANKPLVHMYDRLYYNIQYQRLIERV